MTAGSSSGPCQRMGCGFRTCSCTLLMSLHIGVSYMQWLYIYSRYVTTHALARLTVNHCYTESRGTRQGVSGKFVRTGAGVVVPKVPKVDLAYLFSRSCTASCQPICFGTHHSSPLYSATSWTQSMLNSSYLLWDKSGHTCRNAQSGFCFRGLCHATYISNDSGLPGTSLGWNHNRHPGFVFVFFFVLIILYSLYLEYDSPLHPSHREKLPYATRNS
jgi:hypothetical protein